MNAGVGAALIAVAIYHLVPAMHRGEIPTTRRRPLRREERPREFWVTVSVMSVAAFAGTIIVAASMLG